MSDERTQRYAKALDLHSFRLASTDWQRFVLRVMAVADAEQAELRAEVENQRQSARTAWDVHAEHVETSNVRMLHWQAVAEDEKRRAEAAEAKVADAWDEGYIHGRQLQADATADVARALTSTPFGVRAWLANTARSLREALESAKGSVHDNPYRAALAGPEATEPCPWHPDHDARTCRYCADESYDGEDIIPAEATDALADAQEGA